MFCATIAESSLVLPRAINLMIGCHKTETPCHKYGGGRHRMGIKNKSTMSGLVFIPTS